LATAEWPSIRGTPEGMMMSRKVQLVRILILSAVVVVGMVLTPWLLQVASSSSDLFHEPAVVLADAEPDAADATLMECRIANVGVFDNRIHVRCYNGVGTNGAIVYFATPTSDTSRVARYLSLLLTAEAAGKRVEVSYVENGNGSSFGCAPADCRPIAWLIMLD
jgi:uncharacterized protein (UPF0333 family)